MTTRYFWQRRLLVPALALVVVLATPSIAWAFWSGAGNGLGSASTGDLSGPTSVTATATGTSVTISWAAPTTKPAGATLGYRVTDNGGTTVCGATLLVPSTTCSYTAAPGTYSYTAVAVLGSWTGTSAVSDQVVVSATPASVAVSGGDGQTATVSTAFATALAAKVTDSAGSAVSGILVTFTAPATGASGTFANATKSTTATTGPNGVATASIFTANATAGSYAVTAAVSGVAGTASFALTNQAPAPTVTSASPAVGAGASGITVTVTGTGYQPGARVTFSNAGITGGAVTVASATSLSLSVNVAGTVSAGTYGVTVTNPDNRAGTNGAAFIVNAAPTIAGNNGITPSSIGQGAVNVPLSISGTGFQPGATVTFTASGGNAIAGVTAGTTSVSADKATITVPVSVASSVPVNTKVIVTVMNPDGGSAQKGNAFSIAAGPSVSSISPATIARGTTNVSLTVNGSNFVSGAIVSFGTNGITTGTVTSFSATKIVLNVTVSSSVPKGTYDVTVTNPDGGSGTKVQALTIS